MRRLRTKALTAATMVFMLGAAAACGSSSDGEADSGGPQKVTVGIIAIVDVAPLYLGDEQGFFEERGIELTMESARAARPSCPAS